MLATLCQVLTVASLCLWRTTMALLVVPLLLQTGLVLGSNYGYVEWSDNDRDDKNPPVFSTQNIIGEPAHHPTYYSVPSTERTVVAHKIEEDLPRVVTAFLHTGDSSALRQVNCSRRYELSSLRGGLHVASHYSLHSILDTVAHATNFLNMILQANKSREETLRRDIHWYHALVQSILEGDPKIHRAVVTFHTNAQTPGPHVFLQATRTEKEVVLQDLSSSAHRHLQSRSPESEWFNEFRDRRRPHVHRRVPEASGAKSVSYLLDKKQIKWSAPYLECEHGAFVPYWLLTLSAGFYGLKSNSAPEFRWEDARVCAWYRGVREHVNKKHFIQYFIVYILKLSVNQSQLLKRITGTPRLIDKGSRWWLI